MKKTDIALFIGIILLFIGLCTCGILPKTTSPTNVENIALTVAVTFMALGISLGGIGVYCNKTDF
jgi:hypothetical protein